MKSQGNYVHALKTQLIDLDKMVSTKTMTDYENRRKRFNKEIQRHCHYDVDLRRKEDFVDATIEEDLRFFKANYS